jgi:hypothetical protein
MLRTLLLPFLLVSAFPPPVEEGTTRLRCDGKYSDFVRKIHDVDSRGGYVEIQNSTATVKIVGITEFGSKDGTPYHISHEDQAFVCFIMLENSRYGGCLNRSSGRLTLGRTSATKVKEFDQYFVGDCL